MAGPVTQHKLFQILLWLRLHPVAITGDICTVACGYLLAASQAETVHPLQQPLELNLNVQQF